jgi:hypothetical protein
VTALDVTLAETCLLGMHPAPTRDGADRQLRVPLGPPGRPQKFIVSEP